MRPWNEGGDQPFSRHGPDTAHDPQRYRTRLARADALLDRTGNKADEREPAEIVAAIDACTDAMKVLRGVPDNPHETSNVTANGVGEE